MQGRIVRIRSKLTGTTYEVSSESTNLIRAYDRHGYGSIKVPRALLALFDVTYRPERKG